MPTGQSRIDDPWKTSYGVEVVPNEHFPEGKLCEVTVCRKGYQLYPHETRYLRDLLNAALPPENDSSDPSR